MTPKRPLILICNDDGIEAKGLFHLIDCMADFGEIIAVAPDSPQSGRSSAITVDAPLSIRSHPDYNGAKMYSVNGTPVDCIKLALHAVVPSRPALVLSGINHGSNSGNSVIYSGTMGAVLEACMIGIPAIGFSLLHHSLEADFSQTTPFVRYISDHVLAYGLPEQICLNVNIPAMCTPKGIKVLEASRGYWTEEYADYMSPHGKPFYMLTGRFKDEDPDNPRTDNYWLDREYVSVVPVRPDQTDASAIGAVNKILRL